MAATSTILAYASFAPESAEDRGSRERESVPHDVIETAAYGSRPRREPAARRNLSRGECAVEIDDYLQRLARQEARCRRELGRFASAFLVQRAHQQLGFARLGDYTNERLGLSAREVQSVAHTVGALERLPLIAASFERGEISWTQLRMLAAVTTAQTEASWLQLARGRTVRALEALLMEAQEAQASAVQAVIAECNEDGAIVDGEQAVRFRLQCPRRRRRLWRQAVELARRVAGEEVPVWQAAEAIAAEGLSGPVTSLDGRCVGASSETRHCQPEGGTQAEGASRADRSRQTRRTPCTRHPHGTGDSAETSAVFGAIDWSAVEEAIPDDIVQVGCDPKGLDAFALDTRLRAVVRAMQRVDWQTGRLLQLFFDSRLYAVLGFSSAAQYVRERLGISVRKARSLIALERASRLAPVLAEAYQQGEISWLRALAILPVVHANARARGNSARMGSGARRASTDAPWVQRGNEVTVRRLSDEVAWALDARDTGGDARDGGVDIPSGAAALAPIAPPPLGAPLDGEVRQLRALGTGEALDGEIQFIGPASVVALLRSAITAFTEPSEPLWRGCERLLAHAKAEWEHQPKHRDPIFDRDGWRCAVPACSSRKNLHDHHIRFRSRGGDNARDNRTAVCTWHHLHGIHKGRVRAWGGAPEAIRWSLGVRPGHPPLLELLGDRYLPHAGA